MKEKTQQHQRFWQGQGPSLLLLAPDNAPLYDTTDYRRRVPAFLRPAQAVFLATLPV